MAEAGLSIARATWDKAVRIVPTRFPPVGPFDTVADPGELQQLYEVEAWTNERLAEDFGQLELVDPADRIVGPGTTPIMAAFTHPRPSRFTDGSFGVYYCAEDELTARRETGFHRERFMRLNRQPPQDLDMREYVGALDANLHDLRGQKHADPVIFAPDDYTAANALGERLRAGGSWGIVYDSVRDPRDLPCAAVFRPPALGPVQQRRHLVYEWDGTRIATMRAVEELPM